MLAEQIRNKDLLEESINEFKKENPSANLQLLEKTIGALYLVENLANNGLDFIFKGGTSLVLLLNDLKRFSVDVDIITMESREKVLQCIKNIVENNELFIRYEENIRENSASQRMKLQHFKFFFKSATDESEKYILLDIAYEDNKYPETITKKIQNNKLKVASESKVKLPSIESILGDKLTVLATKTTGISYNSGKELELMKQLYDVDKLFNASEDVKIIRESFIDIATRELKYRKLFEVTYDDVLDDIEEFCNDIILLNQEHIKKINSGMKSLKNFILEKNFLIDIEVLTAASKVLYLISLIKDKKSKIEKYNENVVISENIIPLEYKKRLNKIKKYNKEAYYYILKSFE